MNTTSDTIPRNEYPRPQFRRQDWLCLNGYWDFEIDQGDSGLERGLLETPFKQQILVPFCPESSLSGIGTKDFLNAVWYRRQVTIPQGWSGKRILLHFQAVDYDATVWVNGEERIRHRGGFTPFSCELTSCASGGERFEIVLRARDNHRLPIPKGKQSASFHPGGCHYTRTTGIWQTVWLEPVDEVYMQRPQITPDTALPGFHIRVPLSANRKGWRVRAILRDGNEEVVRSEAAADAGLSPLITLPIAKDRVKLWQPGPEHAFLYDLRLELIDNNEQIRDALDSYAGLRSITIDGRTLLINGQRIFQRQVLDQGYYPDGILTAPSDEALKNDILLALQAGFNAARLHQKVFEERFLYHADRLGYLVWGEFADWHHTDPELSNLANLTTFVTQWQEALQRDFSHPSIIGWCGLNETHNRLKDRISDHDDLMRAMFLAAFNMDPTRPVLDTSGYSHRVPESHVYDCHDYCQDPVKFRENQAGLVENKPFRNESNTIESIPYRGQPYFVSEFGGIWWNPDAGPDEYSWGYGNRPRNIEEFYERFEGLCNVLLDNPEMFGYCYTQLTDVYQEQNGIYTFDRRLKFDMERIRAIQTRPAAYEQKED